ncbi:MAG: TauD/TfdA family dioxygenase [Alphaproteobacteria bacterium]|nr:TauD/TfdA family dioxygenase [Alphaproteobacteria bacterium]
MSTTMMHTQPLSNPGGPIDGPGAWYRADMADPADWTYTLSEADIDEIEAALARARASCDGIIDIDRARFPLPRLGPELRRLRDDVMNGRGFAVLRGLPVERYAMADAAAIYFGLGTHVGSARSQNAEGHVLGHIRDIGHDHLNNADQRGYRAPGPMSFHTDSVDIVSLMCLQPAMRGGESRMVSSITVHNEIWKRRPDLAPLLFEPVHRDRRGEVPADKDPWWIMPLYQWYEGRLFSHFSAVYILSAERFDGVPPFTDEQKELLALIETIANEPENNLEMAFAAGDIQFLNNHQIFHGRAAYEDWPEAARRRYLLRLWICPPNGPPLPPAYAERYGSIEIGDRGGIIVPGGRLQAPLEAV